MNPKLDVDQCRQMIATLNDYRSKNWAIGLGWPAGQPDGIYTFFNDRKLPCQAYLRGNFAVGEPSAYQNNINTLNTYIANVIGSEEKACAAFTAQVNDYKSRNWAIGLTYNAPHQPDSFTSFLNFRGLAAVYYVRAANFSIGDASAYDHINTEIANYLKALKGQPHT